MKLLRYYCNGCTKQMIQISTAIIYMRECFSSIHRFSVTRKIFVQMLYYDFLNANEANISTKMKINY